MKKCLPSSQSPAFKAPYTRILRSNGAAPLWAFSRKGYRVRLPERLAEPWYSPEYADALVQSGLRGIQDTLTVLRCVIEDHAEQEDSPSKTARRGQIDEGDLCHFLRFLPVHSPERVALMLMIHTGEDLGIVIQITPDDPRSYKALWQSPDLIRELPFPHSIKEPYVAASGCAGIDKSTISKRLREAAAHAGLPEPTRGVLRRLHNERVAEAIARVAA